MSEKSDTKPVLGMIVLFIFVVSLTTIVGASMLITINYQFYLQEEGYEQACKMEYGSEATYIEPVRENDALCGIGNKFKIVENPESKAMNLDTLNSYIDRVIDSMISQIL